MQSFSVQMGSWRDAPNDGRDTHAPARRTVRCVLVGPEYNCDVIRRAILFVGGAAVSLPNLIAALAEIQSNDCARAAKYSESRRGVALLVMQNDRTIFERYARGAVAEGRWPIFSGTK